MRSSYNDERKKLSTERLMDVDLHRFLEAETKQTPYELALEFGLSIRDVRQLKKHLERN
ncbi:hypothetical protein HXA34_07905 [Salipaludibacillus agaradhaerens]|jgi:hypothetical protein|uniref:RNA polymerase subunit sigma-70 n=1 Tax=Salipaludibacillus agaradhaerens TaxID=76935 RepID=A0A9Q4B280_SALAG|nr:hypothetical protein [Salipaludibacillus agaradhaerens]MCR6110277.1 hypothetical protein [Bacillus sp. A301a_S52]UJW57348.1 hypothetical protein HXZ66_08030 [Bacillus sp. A116_S68]MCR6096969.1 hypothetical protein [Salipaludibacillus agaradhaerens]MCR6106203.1 hypothetical protein [Salipaludibacillus agaradhaerens]MCR6113546.1 hypothetical protein [Salipaludibacillus agaradhaerens]